jgi:hypothetical protein
MINSATPSRGTVPRFIWAESLIASADAPRGGEEKMANANMETTGRKGVRNIAPVIAAYLAGRVATGLLAEGDVESAPNCACHCSGSLPMFINSHFAEPPATNSWVG